MIVTIIGGGSSAHTVIPLLSSAGNNVNILTRNPHKWSKEIVSYYILPSGEIGGEINGTLTTITDNPNLVIPKSDIIILCMPVSQYRQALHTIAPYVQKNKKVFLGTVYGQGGFNWMVNEIKMKFHLSDIITFAIGLIPWICRTKEYGKIGVTYGSKKVNCVAIDSQDDFNELNKILLNDMCYSWFKTGKFVLADNFISLTLSVDNQIIHPSRLYGLYLKYGGRWDTKEDVPYFYRDYDQLSIDLLEALDKDYSLIREKIKVSFPSKKFYYMMDYLNLERFSYGSNSIDIMDSFVNSKTLGQIQTPTIEKLDGKWVINKNHRFFNDDIFYGICIAKWITEKLDIKTPTIDRILLWAQQILKVNIIDENKQTLILRSSEKFKIGIPSEYNISSIEELID